MKHTPPKISKRMRNRTPPTAPPTIVPRLLSGKEARVGEVNRALCWSVAVPVPEVSCSTDAVVLGAAVVGGGSAEQTSDEKIKQERKDGRWSEKL